MVNGAGGPRKVNLDYLTTIRQILIAARDPNVPRTKSLLFLSRQGTTDEIRKTATELQSIILEGVKAGELDFTAVASRGAELILELNHQINELTAQKNRAEAELTEATSAREVATRALHQTQVDISSQLSTLQTLLREAQEELSLRPTLEAFNALERNVANYLQTVQERNTQIESLTARLTELTTQAEACQHREREALDNNRELAEKVTQLERERSGIEGRIASETACLQNTIDTAVGAQQAAEFALARIKADQAAVNRELLDTQSRVRDGVETVRQMEGRITEIDQARISALSHQDELKRLSDEAKARQNQAEGELKDLRLKIGDAEKVRREKIDLERELNRLRNEVGRLQRELAQAQEEFGLARTENSQLSSEKVSLLAELDAAQSRATDPEISGIRSRLTEIERMLGEKETELAQKRTRIIELEGALSEKEFDHSQRSGEMAEVVRTRTEERDTAQRERDSAQAELTAARTETERFRQWAEYGEQVHTQTLPTLRLKINDLEDEAARFRYQPRKLPPALNILAELKEKDPKAYSFILKMLITIATKINEESKKAAVRPTSASGSYDNNQKTAPSPSTVQAVEIDEFQNRAVFVLDMISRSLELKEKDPSAAHLLTKLHRFLTKAETAPEAKVEMTEFLEKIIKDPSLIRGLTAQAEEIEEIDMDKNVRKALLSEIEYLAAPANENEFQNRAHILYNNYREQLEQFLNDSSIDDTTKATVRKIISDASQASAETISFEEPTKPEGKPEKKGVFSRWFKKKE